MWLGVYLPPVSGACHKLLKLIWLPFLLVIGHIVGSFASGCVHSKPGIFTFLHCLKLVYSKYLYFTYNTFCNDLKKQFLCKIQFTQFKLHLISAIQAMNPMKWWNYCTITLFPFCCIQIWMCFIYLSISLVFTTVWFAKSTSLLGCL